MTCRLCGGTERLGDAKCRLCEQRSATLDGEGEGMGTELVRHEEVQMISPKEVITQATEEANVLRDVIEKKELYSVISGKRYVRAEGWQTLAVLRGCIPREVETVEREGGRYISTVELVRISDGRVLSRASSECGGPEESMWQGRPPNARRSMAQTRATAKACRIAFSWVMSLSGFEPTPAEEMDFVQSDMPKPPPPKQEGETYNMVCKIREVKKTKSPKTGKEYYEVNVENRGHELIRLSTFSDTDADAAQSFQGHGEVKIFYTVKKVGQKSYWNFLGVEEV